jgi:uncharacterized protein (DUF58 family)
MDWSKISRRKIASQQPRGVYAGLEDLVRIRFRARDFSFQPRQPVTSVLSGRYGSRLRGRGLDFEELRSYQPGDDVRTMDWRVTARTRSPHVRVFSEEKDRAVLLVVDQRLNMFFGTRNRLKSVTAAELAALGGWRALDSGDRIGGVLFNDERLIEFRPERSEKNLMAILHGLLGMNHALRADSRARTAPDMLNRALEKVLRLAPHDVLVVIVSDFFGVDARSEQLTARIAAHNDILGVLVHDPMRVEPAAELLRVGDGGREAEIDLRDARLRQRLVADYRAEQQRITHFLRRLSAPLLMISNQGDVVEQVRRLLGVPARSANG